MSASIKKAVPVSAYSLEGRYANALFSAATKQRATAQVAADIPTLKKVFSQGNPKLLSQVHPLSKNFMKVLAENNRLGFAEKILSAFSVLVDSSAASTVTVTSAQVWDLDYRLCKN